MTYGQTEFKITQKKCLPRKGIYMRLNSVFDDSRCPDGVNCIWAGEVSATFEVYKDRKIMEERTLLFNFKNLEENKKWFEKYYSKKIKSLGLLPYPKEGVTIKPKKHYLKIVFAD